MRLGAALLPMLLVACAGLAPERTEGRDPGGSLLLRAAEVAALERRGEERRVGGRCDSACTLFLGFSTACFEEGAVLGFHGPRPLTGGAFPPAQFDRLSRFMAGYYPERVAAWFMAEGRWADPIALVPAAELVARGEARACPPA